MRVWGDRISVTARALHGVLVQRFAHGDSMAVIARAFGIEADYVETVIRIHLRQLAAPGRERKARR